MLLTSAIVVQLIFKGNITMSDQMFYLLSAALLGIVVGALIMYFISLGNKDSDTTKIEEKLNNYQQDVVQHFEQTADLVDDLTQSYKKVFDHLNKSARELMTEEQLKLQIEKRKGQKVTLEFLSEEDYANPVTKEYSETKLAEESNQIDQSDSSEDEGPFSLVADEEKLQESEEITLADEQEAAEIKDTIADEETQENELIVDLDQEVQEREKHIYH